MTESLINNYERVTQVKDFRNLKFARNITPTDIDAFIDFGNKAFVIIEAKSYSAGMPWGQKLAIERLTDCIALSGKPVIFIVFSHGTKSSEDIDFSKYNVTECRIGGRWIRPERVITVKQLIIDFLTKHGLSEYAVA